MPGQAKRALLTRNQDDGEEIQVKKGHSWSEQVGIAIACLVEKGDQELVEWVTEARAAMVAHLF